MNRIWKKATAQQMSTGSVFFISNTVTFLQTLMYKLRKLTNIDLQCFKEKLYDFVVLLVFVTSNIDVQMCHHSIAVNWWHLLQKEIVQFHQFNHFLLPKYTDVANFGIYILVQSRTGCNRFLLVFTYTNNVCD
jgi:hypothetical protein